MSFIQRCMAPVEWLFERVRVWAQSFNPYVPEELSRDGIEPVKIEESAIKKQAGWLVMVTFLVFLVWSVTAPIDSGAVMNGTVVVNGSRKAVQHPSGGVVEELLVHEGSQVRQGEVLVRINPLNIEANLRQAESEYINALAAYSRLLAERTEQADIKWDKGLAEFSQSGEADEAKRLHTALFRSRRSEYVGQRDILSQQADGYRQQLREKENILALRKGQLAPIAEDARSIRHLAQDGYVPRSKANEAERSNSEALAGISSLQSDLATVRTELAAVLLEAAKLKSAFLKGVDAELAEVQKQKESGRAKVQALRFDKSLSELRAPVTGTVVALKAHTVGGVISGGQVLMEIVPNDQSLIVEAAVPPHLIDKVEEGMATDLRFSAFNSITTPVVPGVVRLVGADRLPPAPPVHPEEYYLAHIEVTADGLKLLAQNNIVAGMPVEVIVKNGERSFMSYLLKPLTDRFARSFKE